MKVLFIGVCAVVVTYNRLNLLKQCLQHLLNQNYKLDKIVVINNNSSDGTKEYLDNLNNKRFIIKDLSKNLGGAGGFSLGTKVAYEETDLDYIWIMDDDTMPTKSALSKLMNKTKLLKGKFGFLCSNVRWWKNGAPCNMPVVTKDWTKLISYSLIKVEHATFVSVLIPRNRIKELGLPIGQMFIWGDDTEYTTRLSSHYDSYFVPDSVVLHKSATNKSYETIFNAVINRVPFYKCMYRNLIYIDKKYYPIRRRIKNLLAYFTLALEVPFKAKDHRIYRMLTMFDSIAKGLVFNPKIQFPR